MMKFLIWGAIVCSLLGLLASATLLILSQAFAVGSVITTAVSTVNVAVNAAVLTFNLMTWRDTDAF